MLRTLFAMLVLPIGLAEAGGFEAKTMRDSLSSREVERPLVIGKGWLEAGLGYSHKSSTGYWDAEGEAVDFDDANWLYTTQSVHIRYGIARRGELWWRLPFHYARLTNDKLNTDTSSFGMGDPSFGYKLELYRSAAPTTSVVTEIFYKAPAGDDSPGNFIGGPNTFNNIVMTTGTPDLGFGIKAKRQVGPLAFTAGAEYVHRFSGAVGYVIETEFSQFQARIKPGDLVNYELDVMFQLGPVALHNAWYVSQRFETRVGPASNDLFGSSNLKAIEGSDGTNIDGLIGAVLNLTRGVDVLVDVRRSIKGEDNQFFPIEQIHPTRGTTFSTALELRY